MFMRAIIRPSRLPASGVAETPERFGRTGDRVEGAEDAFVHHRPAMVVFEVARAEAPLGEVPVAFDREVGARPSGVGRHAGLEPERVVGADPVEVDAEDERVEVGHVRPR